jgi:hypothetical protein
LQNDERMVGRARGGSVRTKGQTFWRGGPTKGHGPTNGQTSCVLTVGGANKGTDLLRVDCRGSWKGSLESVHLCGTTNGWWGGPVGVVFEQRDRPSGGRDRQMDRHLARGGGETDKGTDLLDQNRQRSAKGAKVGQGGRPSGGRGLVRERDGRQGLVCGCGFMASGMLESPGGRQGHCGRGRSFFRGPGRFRAQVVSYWSHGVRFGGRMATAIPLLGAAPILRGGWWRGRDWVVQDGCGRSGGPP